jgi:hypothetical protein
MSVIIIPNAIEINSPVIVTVVSKNEIIKAIGFHRDKPKAKKKSSNQQHAIRLMRKLI